MKSCQEYRFASLLMIFNFEVAVFIGFELLYSSFMQYSTIFLFVYYFQKKVFQSFKFVLNKYDFDDAIIICSE